MVTRARGPTPPDVSEELGYRWGHGLEWLGRLSYAPGSETISATSYWYRGTFICERSAALTSRRSSRRPPRAPALLPKSLAACWRLPPRLRHRGDCLHRSRHAKARLLKCGTPRCVRPCARTLILAGSGKRQPSFCERGKPGPPVHMSARRCTAVVKARFHHRANRSSNSGGRWASHRMHQSSCHSLSDSVQQMLPFSKSSRGSACGQCSSRDVALKPR